MAGKGRADVDGGKGGRALEEVEIEVRTEGGRWNCKIGSVGRADRRVV